MFAQNIDIAATRVSEGKPVKKTGRKTQQANAVLLRIIKANIIFLMNIAKFKNVIKEFF